MAYQIKRTQKFVDKLELCGKNGEVEKTLEINIDVDAIAGDFRHILIAVQESEDALKKAQVDNNIESFDGAYTAYGNAVVSLFELTLGKANTAELLEFYENRYTEMSLQVVPYITTVIIPLISAAIKRKKQELKKLGRR